MGLVMFDVLGYFPPIVKKMLLILCVRYDLCRECFDVVVMVMGFCVDGCCLLVACIAHLDLTLRSSLFGRLDLGGQLSLSFSLRSFHSIIVVGQMLFLPFCLVVAARYALSPLACEPFSVKRLGDGF